MSVRYLDNRRAAKRLSWVLLFSIGVAMTVSLYYVKTRAQSAKKEVKQLERSLEREAAAIKVLEAELAYLSGPERLSELSQQSLGLQPISPDNTKNINEINSVFPIREVENHQGEQP